jgi:hypothetical protein
MKCPLCKQDKIKDEFKPFNGDENLLQVTGDLVCGGCGVKFSSEVMRKINIPIPF